MIKLARWKKAHHYPLRSHEWPDVWRWPRSQLSIRCWTHVVASVDVIYNPWKRVSVKLWEKMESEDAGQELRSISCRRSCACLDRGVSFTATNRNLPETFTTPFPSCKQTIWWPSHDFGIKRSATLNSLTILPRVMWWGFGGYGRKHLALLPNQPQHHVRTGEAGAERRGIRKRGIYYRK